MSSFLSDFIDNSLAWEKKIRRASVDKRHFRDPKDGNNLFGLGQGGGSRRGDRRHERRRIAE
jgi:hypothetical protein